jgi:glycosyltransferase involved in cell wall biosynthesis
VAKTSVLLAAFGSQWIPDAIDSVLSQTRQDWELLVLDDANSPATREVVERLSEPRVRYIANEVRLGPALNHQKGIELASYELLACINHDDIWEPQFLERLVGGLEAEAEAVVAFGDYWIVNAENKINQAASDKESTTFGRAGLRAGVHRQLDQLGIVQQAIAIAQCAVWRKNVIPQIPWESAQAYDYWVAIALAVTGRPGVYVPERLARWRLHTSNLEIFDPLRRRIRTVIFYHRLLHKMDLGTARPHIKFKRREALVHLAKWPAWLVARRIGRR